MTPEEHAAWALRRRRGGWFYVLRHGVLTHGLGFAVLMSVARWYGVLGGPVRDPRHLALDFAVLALMYGGLNGWLDWRRKEAAFQAGPVSDDPEQEVECLRCHAMLPYGETCCPACGWTYEEPDTKTPPSATGD